MALQAGVTTIYLLTETAEQFFKARDYVVIDRADAPKAIVHTEEFGGLCSADAVLMRKALV